MKHYALALGLAWPLAAQAQWTFDPALDVTSGKGLFHHLEASGRQALAISGNQVAITWEDDRTGTPRCYLAIKAEGQNSFSEQGFGQGECYAPGIAAMADGRFAVIWEDETGVKAAVTQAGKLGPATSLADKGSQSALAWHPRLGLMATWSGQAGHLHRLWLGRMAVDNDQLRLTAKYPLEPSQPKDDQLFPALVSTSQGVALAWEDRRLGHTVIFGSRSDDGATWAPPTRVSQNPTGKAQGTDLGRGTGAMRPTLATMEGDKVATVWLDKRDFLSGYDVYAALPGDTTGKNTKVQDSFGDAIAQWHPASTGNGKDKLVVAWDDDRDGTPDIWLGWLTPQGIFSENIAPPPAAGPHQQTDPVLALDDAGRLHLAWVERDASGQSSIRYSLGYPEPAPEKN